MSNNQKILLSKKQHSERQDFDWGHLTWFANGPLGNSTDMTVGRCVLSPGCGNPRHYHPNCSEVLVVIEGRIMHTVSEAEEAEMQPGDTVTIPPNIWHSARNIGATDAVLYIAFSSPDRKTVGE